MAETLIPSNSPSQPSPGSNGALWLSQGGRLPALNGVRGLAIFLVLLLHAWTTGPAKSTPILAPLNVLMQSGWVGVDLFFVLSGFLITGILYDSLGQAAYFKNFYARRILRIFPLYYAFLFFVAFLFVPVVLRTHVSPGTHDGAAYLQTHQLWFWLYGQNFLPFFVRHPNLTTPLAHFWSLAVEEHFYLFWPLAVFLLRKRIVWLAAFFFCLSFVLRVIMMHHGVDEAVVYEFTFTRLDGLATGSALAIWFRGQSISMAKANQWATILLCLTAAGVAALLWRYHRFNYADPGTELYGFTLTAVMAGSLLCKVITLGSSLEKFFRNRFLTDLGKYSYGMYVVQSKVFFVMAPLWTHKIGRGLGWQFLYFPLCFVCVYGLARLVFKFWEAPFLRYKVNFHAKAPASRQIVEGTPAPGEPQEAAL